MLNKLYSHFEASWPDPDNGGRAYLEHLEPYVTAAIDYEMKQDTLLALVMRLSKLPEAEAAKLIEFGSVWLDRRPCLHPDEKLERHATFRLNPPRYKPGIFYEASPQRIVYEDDDILIYNKESGRPSQSVPHDAHNNALSALERYLSQRDGGCSLWLLHRLDSDTSGLLMFAKNKRAAGLMGKAFQESLVRKEYLALSCGEVQDVSPHFSVKTFIDKEKGRYLNRVKAPGLFSHTDFRIMAQENSHILFQAIPITGRTHQIRLHLQYSGWPIVGDRLYGGFFPAPRLMLSACALCFPHPRNAKILEVKLPC